MHRGGKVASEGGTQEPRGGKPLYMSTTLKNSSLAQKCLNTRLNLHFLASLSPKPFSFGMRGNNRCCRATGNLQNFQHQHRLKLHCFQTMRHQSTLHENWKTFKDLEIFPSFQTAIQWSLWSKFKHVRSWISLWPKNKSCYSTQILQLCLRVLCHAKNLWHSSN